MEKLTRSSLKGFFNRALFAYKNRHFASSFLLLGKRTFIRLLKANLSFQSTSPKRHLNRTGSVFALPKEGGFCVFQRSFTERTVPVPVSVSGKRFRRSRFRVRFLQKRFRRFRFRFGSWDTLLFLSKNYRDFEAASLAIWCSEGYFAQFDLILTLF